MLLRIRSSLFFMALATTLFGETAEALLATSVSPKGQINTESLLRMREQMNDSSISEKEMARRIMYHQHRKARENVRYQIIAAEPCDPLARRIEDVRLKSWWWYWNHSEHLSLFICTVLWTQKYPDRFTYHPTNWDKFPDGTDNIEIGGFSPRNLISGEHVLFLASFHNNDITLSQFQVMICLLQSFIESLTVVLPYSPVGKSSSWRYHLSCSYEPASIHLKVYISVYSVHFCPGTMERVISEGQVATAATYAHMFSSLPNCGKPTRLMVYDLHTLQNRFYLVRICRFWSATVCEASLSDLKKSCSILITNRRAGMRWPRYTQPFLYSRRKWKLLESTA